MGKAGQGTGTHLGGANPDRGSATQEPRLRQQLLLAEAAAASVATQGFGVALEVLPGTPATPMAGKSVPSMGTLSPTPHLRLVSDMQSGWGLCQNLRLGEGAWAVSQGQDAKCTKRLGKGLLPHRWWRWVHQTGDLQDADKRTKKKTVSERVPKALCIPYLPA